MYDDESMIETTLEDDDRAAMTDDDFVPCV